MAVNSAGDIAGTLIADDGVRHAALWRRGVLYDLGTPPGFASAAAVALNDSGVVVTAVWNDSAERRGGDTRTFLWRAGRFCRPSNMPPRRYGATMVEATALNDVGQLAGVYSDSTYSSRPFVWTAGIWRRFDAVNDVRFSLGEYHVETVAALNDSGVFVGQARSIDEESPDRRRAITRQADGIDLIANISDRNSEAVAINNRGDVLGSYWPQNARGPRVAFVLRGGRNLITFPPRVPPGRTDPRARRRALVPVVINNAGSWVGMFEGGLPVVIDAEGAVRTLPVPSLPSEAPAVPTAMNDSGVVVGWLGAPNQDGRDPTRLNGLAVVWRGGRPAILPLVPSASGTQATPAP